MVYINRNRFISITFTQFYVIAMLSVIPYTVGLVHLIELNNTYHTLYCCSKCMFSVISCCFGYYFNICLTFKIFKTIVLLRKERLPIPSSLIPTGLKSLC